MKRALAMLINVIMILALSSPAMTNQNVGDAFDVQVEIDELELSNIDDEFFSDQLIPQ